MEAETVQRNILFVLLAAGLIGLVIAVMLLTNKSPSVRLSDQALFEMRVKDLIVQEVSQATKLAEDGRHMEAARVLVSAAGVQRALLPHEGAEGGGAVATMIESMALQQLSLVGKDQAYREFLRTLYPEWKTESMPSAP